MHATNDARDLYKTYATEVGLLGDAALTLTALSQAVQDRLGGRKRENSTAAEIARVREAWLAKWRAKLAANDRPINPYRVIAEFTRVIDPAEAIVTHDSGSPREQILPFYRATRPRSYLGWGKSHQLGTGLGLTIGAKLAAPEKFCVNFMGDAAFGMTGLDFETAVRCGAPILTVVLNNSTMAIETRHMGLSHEKFRARDLGGSYAALARDLGGWSERVEDPGQIADAILRARRQTQEGRAALLEFITSEETAFSQGAGAQA
jgi:acetolactate synthase-1/2/3 large subunit